MVDMVVTGGENEVHILEKHHHSVIFTRLVGPLVELISEANEDGSPCDDGIDSPSNLTCRRINNKSSNNGDKTEQAVRVCLNEIMIANFLSVKVVLTKRANKSPKKRGLDSSPGIKTPMNDPRDKISKNHSNQKEDTREQHGMEVGCSEDDVVEKTERPHDGKNNHSSNFKVSLVGVEIHLLELLLFLLF